MQTPGRTNVELSCFFRNSSIRIVTSILIVLAGSSYIEAQDAHGYTFDVGAGFSPLVADISTRLDNGWHVTFGGGYNFTSHFTTTVNYTHHGFGVSDKVLAEADVPGGNAHLWSITVDPKLRLNRHSRLDPYVVGGVGYYRRTIEFTQPALIPVFLFDPFFGAFYNTLVPGNQVIGKISEGGEGGSLGGGFDVKLGESGVKVFAEARYHYADTGRIATRMIPVTFGIRW
jgi:hypothetical protein